MKNKLFVLVLVFLLSFSFSTNRKLQILQVFDIIQNNFVEKDVEAQKLAYGSIKGMLKSLDDPYSRFLEPKKYSEMKINLQGNFYGVGIHIGIKNNRLTVIAPIYKTPAYRAGIKSLDVIAEIDEISTEKMSLEEAVTKIRGPKGTKVVLGIERDGEAELIQIPIIRDKIKLKSVDTVEIVSGNVGYIRLTTFESKNATNEVLKAVKKLRKKGMKRLILDLRNNGGGLLANAKGMTSLFVDSGVVVFTVDRNGNKQGILVDSNKKIFDGPLVVLVNGASASASEIVAGAIRDHDRGELVGTTTFGKASVQNIIPLSDGSAILLTIAKYLTPDGDNIHGHGITPDIIVKVPSEDIQAIKEGTYEYSIETDFQLQKAIDIVNSL